jgi:hypothetical protein
MTWRQQMLNLLDDDLRGVFLSLLNLLLFEAALSCLLGIEIKMMDLI